MLSKFFLEKKYRRLIGLACFILLVILGLKLATIPFWGYLVLVFFILSWLLITIFLKQFFWDSKEKLYYLGLIALSGILLALAFPPLPLAPLSFVAFVPLLILQERIEQSDINSKNLRHFIYSYFCFLLWNFLATFWVANAALIPSLVAFTLNSLFMSIPWLGMIIVGRRFPQFKWLAFFSFWFCWEYIHLNWEISWPWLTLGNTWASLPSLIQWYEVTGVFGGGLWILVANWFVFELWKSKQNQNTKSTKKYGFSLILWIAIPSLISLFMYLLYDINGVRSRILIVQANYEPHFQKFSIPESIQCKEFQKLSNEFSSEQTEFILWPETSIGNEDLFKINSLKEDERITWIRDSILKNNHSCLITGITSVKFFLPNEPLSPAARQSNSNPNSYYEIGNTALMVSKEKEDYYIKSKLVPGAEIFPYKNLLPFLNPIVKMLGGSAAGFAQQKERQPFIFNDKKVAPVICYESIYGEYLQGFFRQGSQALFVLTNDGWWDDTPGYKQHAYYSILRAIEYRKPVVRATNTGSSCFINAKGNVQWSSRYDTKIAHEQDILLNNEHSFYEKTGDFIAWLACVISILFLIIYWSTVIKSKLF